jgi:hypothetical protein
MRTILYFVTLLVTIYWALGAFVWDLGNLVHAMLGLAVIAFLSGKYYPDNA